MSPRTSIIGLLLAGLALLSGCVGPSHSPQWVSAKVSVGNERLLLEVTDLALRKTGFPVGAGLDSAKLVATSGWKISLAPFKGEGYREQATVKYSAEGQGKYKAEVRVQRDRNEDIVHPLDLTYAEWESDPDDVEKARVLLGFIQSLLSTGNEVLKGTPHQP
jgi:hypothetical protein